jgi:hypothetical protein
MTTLKAACVGAATAAWITATASAVPFTYQGQLKQDGRPVTAVTTMDFGLFDGPDSPTPIAGPLRIRDIEVVNGLFTVEVDFGDGVFDGSERYLGVSVVVPPGTTPVLLSPRQKITAAPFAMYALDAPGGSGGGTLDDAYNFGGAGAGRVITADAGPVYISGTDGLAVDGGVVTGAVKLARADASLDIEARKSFNVSGDQPDPVTVGGTQRRGALLNPIEDWAYLRVASVGHAIRRKIGTTLAFDVEGSINNSAIWISQMFLDADGNLGVGTVIPSTRLHVNQGEDASVAAGGYLTIGSINSTNLVFDNNEILARNAGFVSDLYLNRDSGDVLIGTGGAARLGIGTTNPKGRIHVAGDYYGLGHMWLHAYEGDGSTGTAYIQARDTSGTSDVNLQFRTKDGTVLRDVMRLTSLGRVGIGTTAPAQLLHVNGTARVNVLQITGGSDLSEGFDVQGEAIEPGMVVSIDPDNPGRLIPSRDPYDRKVAGIVSGAGGVATGMVMGHSGTIADGEHPIALSGRVYCLVDATAHAVEPGDLLTTSAKTGHAMKVVDHDRANGAVLGKAMTALRAGQTGLVLVLVSLQ